MNDYQYQFGVRVLRVFVAGLIIVGVMVYLTSKSSRLPKNSVREQGVNSDVTHGFKTDQDKRNFEELCAKAAEWREGKILITP